MNRLETAITVISEKAEKYTINGLHTAELLQQIQDFKVKIVLVGAFSAGKSALLNAFLSRDLLEENQRPETAVASELLYDRQEFVEIVSDTEVKTCPPENVSALDMADVQYLRWHLNDAALQKLGGYVLVDMPGFNSGIHAHNKAILQYADQANAYLLVIDAEDGGIKQSVSTFINEVRHYEDNMAIVITKSDLKTESDIALVQEAVEETAEELFDQSVTVITTSRFDPQVQQKLQRLIRQFDRESIFRQSFVPPVTEMGEQVIHVMEVLKKNASFNLSDLEEEIRTREKAKTQLAQKLQQERQNLSDKLQNDVKCSILSDAEYALRQQAESLANCLESGGTNFSMLVNNILRPVLVSSTQSYVEESFDEFVSAMAINTNHFDQDAGLNEFIERYQEINTSLKKLPETVDRFNTIYKAVTTSFAVLTSVVAPWLEIVLIFLPDVLRLLSPLFKKRQSDKILNEVQNRVIPGIIEKLNPSVSASLREMEAEMVAKLEEKLGEMIDLETSALESAKERLTQRQEDHAQKIAAIDQDIADVRSALNAM